MRKKRLPITKGSAGYGVLFLSGGGLVLQVLGFFYRVMLSKVAGAEAMGLFSLLMPVYAMLISCLTPGLSLAVSSLAAAAWATGRKKDVDACVRSAQKLFFLGFLVVFSLCFLLSKPLSTLLTGDAALSRPLRLLLLCLFFSGAENTKKAALMAAEKIEPTLWAELTEQGVRFIAVWLFLCRFSPSSAYDAVFLIVCGMAVSELCGGLALHILYRRAIVPSFEKVPLRALLRIAAPVGAGRTVSSLFSSLTARFLPAGLMLYGFSRDSALFEIGAACSMAGSLSILTDIPVCAIAGIAMQRLAALSARRDRRALKQALCRTVTATEAVCLFGCVFLLFFGKPLCFLIFHNESAVRYVPFFACFSILSGFSCSLHAVENGLGLEARSALSETGSVLILLSCTLWLVPRFGLFGYLFGLLIGEIYFLARAVHRITRKTAVSFLTCLSSCPLFAALPLVFAARYLARILPIGYPALLGAFTICAAVYGVGLLCFRKNQHPHGAPAPLKFYSRNT